MDTITTVNLEGLHKVQLDILHFIDVVCPNQTISQEIGIVDHELRAKLIEEEAQELCEAIRQGDLVDTIDGMIDLMVVVLGAAVAFNINIAPFWDEVHRTNMAKVDGPIDANGKRLKPDGWTPPQIADVIEVERTKEPFISRGRRVLQRIETSSAGVMECSR